jgi:hypothetical protein
MTGRVSPSAGSMPMSRTVCVVGGPCVCLGRERVVNPDQRVLPGVSDNGGELVAGMEGDRREVDHGQVGDLEQGGEEPVGVGAPCGSPHDLEPGGEFLQPWPVRLAQPYWFFAGEELVFGVAGRAGRCCERVQDSVHVEQEQGEAGGHCPLIVPPPVRAGKSPAFITGSADYSPPITGSAGSPCPRRWPTTWPTG